ncbi:hypothetical protein [Streptomyces zhihengii]
MTTKKQTSVRDRLNARTRPTSRLTICDDHEVKQRLANAEYEHTRAGVVAEGEGTEATRKRLDDAKKALDQARAVFDEAAIVLSFQALERPAWEALKAKHKPTEEQAEEGMHFDAEALAPELIAAASLDGLTVDDARRYLDTWAAGEAIDLYNAALNVQHESRLDVGKG